MNMAPDMGDAMPDLVGLKVRQRAASRATYTAPSNMYRTEDGAWVTIVGSSEATFRRLCAAMERPDLPADPRFATSGARIANVADIDGMVATWCSAQSLASLSAALEQNSVPFSKVYDIADILADPHFQAREAWIRLPDPDLGSVPAPCVVPRFGGLAAPIPRSGPAVGEHNTQIYRALGVSQSEQRRLEKAQVI